MLKMQIGPDELLKTKGQKKRSGLVYENKGVTLISPCIVANQKKTSMLPRIGATNFKGQPTVLQRNAPKFGSNWAGALVNVPPSYRLSADFRRGMSLISDEVAPMARKLLTVGSQLFWGMTYLGHPIVLPRIKRWGAAVRWHAG